MFASEQDARTTQTPHNLCGQILVVCPINFERFVVSASAPPDLENFSPKSRELKLLLRTFVTHKLKIHNEPIADNFSPIIDN